MENELHGIEIEPFGQGYVLTRTDKSGNKTHFILSDDDVLQLAQSAQRLRDHVLAKRSKIGAEYVVMTKVAQIEIAPDAHLSEVHMTMIESDGFQTTYGLDLSVAKPLAESLPRQIAQIERAAKSETKQ